MMSNTGQTVRISMKDVRVMGRSTQGVKLVNLHEGDQLVAVQRIEHIETPEETTPNHSRTTAFLIGKFHDQAST